MFESHMIEKFKCFAWISLFSSQKVLKIKFCVPGFSEFDLSRTKVCKFGGKVLACKAIAAHRGTGDAGLSELPCGFSEA